MPLTQVSAGDRINASDLNQFYSILKGVAASGESVTLIYNAAGAVILQPSSDPAVGTQLFQLKNNAGTVKAAMTAGGGALFSSQVLLAQSTTIASATPDLSAATGNYVQISGTTTITSLGTVQAGTPMILEFQGILTLTHNASSLIMRSGANTTTAAGDVYIFVSEGSGNWREIAHLVSPDINPDQQTNYWRFTYQGAITPNEVTVSGTGAVTLQTPVVTRRLDTGATSGSTAGIREVFRNLSTWAVGKLRRLELQFDPVHIDANTSAYLFITTESATGSPSLTADHIGIKNVAGVVSFSTADGTTEQTTNITAFVSAISDKTYAVTFDGTTARLYIDGTLRATHATNVPRSTLNQALVWRAYITNSTAASKQFDIDRIDALFAAS